MNAPKLVIGANGFLGSHVTRQLVADCAPQKGEVRAMVRPAANTRSIDDLPLTRFHGDVFDTATVAEAMAGCDDVYYCVVDTRAWLRDPSPLFRTNVAGLRNVLDVATDASLRRFVFTSSYATVGRRRGHVATEEDRVDTRKVTPYVRSRVAAEDLVLQYAHDAGLPAVAMCVSTTYGGGDWGRTPHGAAARSLRRDLRPRRGFAGTSRPVRLAGRRTASSHRHLVSGDSVRSIDVVVEAVVTFAGAAGFAHTLAPLRRGQQDPCFRVPGDGTIWRTSLLPTGPVTARISRAGRDAARCVAWGSGAEEFVDMAPAMLGAADDASDFVPLHPAVAAAHRRLPNLRLGRTGQVLEALIPAVIEQRVPGADAFRSWRLLVSKYGTQAPGPAPPGMRVPPSAEVWRHIPSWEFHRANVDPGRARAVVGCAQRAASLERLVSLPAARAAEALTSLPGVGVWTAAETTQRVFGDADAVSVGDYHIPKMIGWTLVGRPVDDAGMLELLEPMRPHRHRVVRLLEASGLAREPRRGPRLPVQNIRAL